MFKIGDVVAVKGSDVLMTVKRYEDATGTVECLWFDKTNMLHHDAFDEAVLQKRDAVRK